MLTRHEECNVWMALLVCLFLQLPSTALGRMTGGPEFPSNVKYIEEFAS